MPDTIEAEVIEIDGRTPEPGAGPEPASGQADWRQWVLRFDRRWWPLWVLLGVAVVALASTLGLVLMACWLVLRLVRGLLRGVARMLGANPG